MVSLQNQEYSTTYTKSNFNNNNPMLQNGHWQIGWNSQKLLQKVSLLWIIVYTISIKTIKTSHSEQKLVQRVLAKQENYDGYMTFSLCEAYLYESWGLPAFAKKTPTLDGICETRVYSMPYTG